MARTGHDGPDYGAYGVLFQAHTDSIAASSTALEYLEISVPADEDWYVDRVAAYCTNQGNGGTTDLESPNGTSLLSADITLTTNAEVVGTLATRPSRIAASASLFAEATDGATTAISDLTMTVWGWRRFIAAPRGRTNPL